MVGIYISKEQFRKLKKDVNKLPDKVQIKEFKNSSKSEIYEKDLDTFLQQFKDDYAFILENPLRRRNTYREKFLNFIEDDEYYVFGTDNLKKRGNNNATGSEDMSELETKKEVEKQCQQEQNHHHQNLIKKKNRVKEKTKESQEKHYKRMEYERTIRWIKKRKK